jgi:hypothetical protein
MTGISAPGDSYRNLSRIAYQLVRYAKCWSEKEGRDDYLFNRRSPSWHVASRIAFLYINIFNFFRPG